MVDNTKNRNESKGDRKSKSTNTSGLFVRDFNTVREIMRSIYLYGCYDKSDYINKEGVLKFKTGTSKGNISRSKVEIEIGRFGFLLGEDFFDAYDSTYHCNYDLFSRVDDAMLTMYRNRTFTRLDIQSYILLLQSLNQLDEDGTYKKVSISDIFTFINADHSKAISMSKADELSCKGNSKPMYYDIAKSKLRDELASLVNLGLINELDISSHTHLYQLKDDIFENFSNQELRNIYRYLDYCGRCLALQTPFYFAKKKIGLYLKSERNDDSEINNHMVYRHNFIYNGLDNDIAIRLLMGIHENRTMELEIYDNSSNTIKIINVIPIKIVHDLWTGKQDALYYELESETAKTCSLDNIYAATLLDEALAKVWIKAKEACEVIHETWRTSLNNEFGKQNVLIEFNIPEENKQAYKRLYYEGVVDHKGKLTKSDKKDQYLFEIDVLDSYDMLTWIKSFGEMATVIKPKHLADRIKSTWQTSLFQMKDDKNLVYDGPYLEAGLTPSVVVDENTIFLKEENFVYEAMCRLINEKVDKDDIFVNDEEVFKAVGEALGRNIRKGVLDFDDDDHKYYDLFGKVDDKYFIRLFRKVPIRLNNLEKEALYNAACLNQALYFLEKETIDKIKKIINEDEIRWSLDDILYKNRNDEPEVFNEGLYSDVRLFEKAISKHQAIECTLSDEKGNEKRVRCYPALMDYYAAKGHMNAILYLKDIDDFLHVTFAQIKDLKMIEGDTLELRDRYLQYMGQNRIKASFEIIPNASAIDRVLRLFSFYPRDMKYNPDSNLYTMTIYYFKEDYHILQKDILSAGRYVRVLSHDRLKNDIYDRTQKALSNYE